MNFEIALATVEGMHPYEAPTEKEIIAAWQWLIDTGHAWRLNGRYGRTADGLIEDEICLPPTRRSRASSNVAEDAAAAT
eukprot:COSAG05_NODE_3272_length_2187_cov_2.856322_1_plen_79_part_00